MALARTLSSSYMTHQPGQRAQHAHCLQIRHAQRVDKGGYPGLEDEKLPGNHAVREAQQQQVSQCGPAQPPAGTLLAGLLLAGGVVVGGALAGQGEDCEGCIHHASQAKDEKGGGPAHLHAYGG